MQPDARDLLHKQFPKFIKLGSGTPLISNASAPIGIDGTDVPKCLDNGHCCESRSSQATCWAQIDERNSKVMRCSFEKYFDVSATRRVNASETLPSDAQSGALESRKVPPNVLILGQGCVKVVRRLKIDAEKTYVRITLQA